MNDSQELDEVLFETAAGMDTPESRESFLDLIRRADPARGEKLRGLLEVNDRATSFFRRAEGARTVIASEAGEELIRLAGPPEEAAEDIEEEPNERIGRYRLIERIGEGGCGVVYLAAQREPVRRQVALKVIRLGMDTERVVARFEMERQSLALMDHPNIARVLDGGATETGRPFFVMEWVRGSRITDYCDAKKLDVRGRIDLFIEVCKGIQHAHQKGVIHRDIKPSNILVSEESGRPTPKVIDFGVAKAVTADPGADASLTAFDQFVGTPAYMSPEQADRKERDIDTRSDVYGLGALLYELLVGFPPFDSKELAEAGVSEMSRILRERDPAPPSDALAALPASELREIANHRNTDGARLMTQIRGDLDSVVLKAIEKDRSRRYETANGLVMDLERFIAHEPVFARPRKRMYVVRKFVRRNRAMVVAAACILLSLLLGLGTASAYYLREKRAREEQARLAKVAEKAYASELQQFAKARGWEGFAHVSLLLSEGKTDEADERLRMTPLSSIQLTPQSSAVLRSLGNWNALRGRWEQAAECFRMLLKADTMNEAENLVSSLDLVAIGSALVESGRPDEYVDFSRWATARFSEDPSVLDVSRLLHSVLLVPLPDDLLASMDDLKLPLETSEFDKRRLTEGWEQESAIWRAFGLALLEYRQGNNRKARSWADVGLSFGASRAYINTALEPVHAMASFRLGDVEGARATLAKTRKQIDEAFAPDLPAAYEPLGKYQGYWWDWIIARILFREAEALVGSENATTR
ncbi:MAG: serine/threonine protein kinase [Verrucomicrobiae bacterium]|nr:serine/threonine protein kinase [Verrucomicrobiae bacterium]